MFLFKPVIITTTVPNIETAERIARILLEKRLAACIQYEHISSCYMWQGQQHQSKEIRMLIKTACCRYRKIEKIIVQQHSYDCPQVLMQPVLRGFKPYLKWIKAELGL